MNNTNNVSAEMSFQKAKDIFFSSMLDKFVEKFGPGLKAEERCRQWVNDLKLSQSEVRLECQFNATSTNFRFGLTQNQPNTTNFQFNTENRLTMQDSLVASEYGIYVGNPTSQQDTAWQLRTYGNSQDFPAADAASINSSFYSQGYFRVTCNGDVVMPYRQLWNHLYKPQTQQTAALGAGSPADQIRGAEDGQITLQPNLLLIGSKGYIPEIIVPAALAITAGQFSRMVLIFRGVLAQNSTSVS